MESEAPSSSRSVRRTRFISGAVMALSLAVLAGIVTYGALQLRGKVRQQILQNHASTLYDVARLEQRQNANAGAFGGKMDDLADQLIVALSVTELKGVIATRLFDARGVFRQGFPVGVRPDSLSPKALEKLTQHRQPVAIFHFEDSITDVLQLEERTDYPGSIPLLVVTIPLHDEDDGPVEGLAQFVIDGYGVEAQLTALDHSLWQQAVLVFAVGGLLLVGVLGLAFRWLIHVNQLLRERTRHLQAANRELSLAARTSALGAITAHLVHGLSSPLSGLNEFVAGLKEAREEDEEVQDALASARRMQSLVRDVVRVISEVQDDSQYEVTMGDLRAQLETRLSGLQASTGVAWNWTMPSQGVLSNRQADLLLFILENLIQNALQATPRGKRIDIRFRRTEEGWLFEVEDQGPGVPEGKRHKVFRPGHSQKSGGIGIGLAISRQLAIHLGASLALQRSDASGCLFAIRLPVQSMVSTPSLLMGHPGAS